MSTPVYANPYEKIWQSRDLSALDKPIEIDNKMPEWQRGLGAFGKEMQGTGYGLAALGSQAVENVIGENPVTKGITDWGLKGYNQSMEESQSGLYKPSVANIEDIKNASDLGNWASYQLGKGIPMLASLAASGGVGGAVARLSANQGVKQLAKAAVGDIVKKTVAEKAIQATEGQVVDKALQEAAKKALMERTLAGATAGAYTGSFGLEGGQAFGEETQAGIKPADAVKSAIAVGGINAALELLPVYNAAKKIGMGEYAKQSIKQIIETNPDLAKRAVTLAGEVGRRAASGAAEGVVTEGITEGLQELTNVAGMRWAKNDPLFASLSDDEWSQVKNAAAAGALVGGVAAGAASPFGGPHAQQKPTASPPPAGEIKTKTKLQELEEGKAKLDDALAAAQTEGDAEKITEIQVVKDLYEKAIEKTKVSEQVISEKPAVEEELVNNQPATPTPPIEVPTTEAPSEVPPVINTEQPGQDINALIKAQEDNLARLGKLKEDLSATGKDTTDVDTAIVQEEDKLKQLSQGVAPVENAPAVETQPTSETPPVIEQPTGEAVPVAPTTPSNTAPAPIQLKQGESIELTPGAAPRVVPTQQETENLQNLMGERPAKNEGDAASQDIRYSKPLGETAQDSVMQEQPLFSYAGRRAATANLGALQQAKLRLNNKENTETIRKETGWFKGRDNKWRFEISDKDFSINEDWVKQQREQRIKESANLSIDEDFITGDWIPETQMARGDKTVNLDDGNFIDKFDTRIGELVNHPKLFAAYPELKNIEVDFLVSTNGHFDPQGTYDPTDNSIRIRAYTYASAKKMLIHELQHAVQNIEGHAAGTHPSIVGNDNYLKSLGEIEARDTANRLDLTEEQRQEQQPYLKTLFKDGIDDKDILVNYNNNVAGAVEKAVDFKSVASIRSNIDSIMGQDWTQQAEALGLIEIIDGPGPNGESGSWIGGKIRLYTGSMPANGSPAGVLLHEGEHHTFNEVLGKALPSYVKDLRTIADNGNKVAQNAISHATIVTADLLGIKHNLRENGNKSDLNAVRALIEQQRPGLLAEEELAYFVQYGVDAQTGKGFWRRLVNQIKAWFAQTRLGQRMKELGIGFELSDGMAVEWAKMGLNKSITKLQQEAQVRARVLQEAANLPASERLGRALAALEQIDPLYSFAGKNALTANLSMLEQAELRLKQGEDKETVRKETGWHQGADGKWRFEIDDSKASFKFPFEEMPESELFKPEQAILLEDVLDHPDLFAAYPQLKKISVIKRAVLGDFEHRAQGWFNDTNLQIGITPYATNPLSTLLHEIQHVIQMYEGFARGGSEESVWGALPVETKENIAKGLLSKIEEGMGEQQSILDFLTQIENSEETIHYLAKYIQASKESARLWDERRAVMPESKNFDKVNNSWLESRKYVDSTDKDLASMLGVDRLYKLSQEKYKTLLGLTRDESIGNLKNKAQVRLAELLNEKTKVQSGDEETIRKKANLYEFYRRLAGETEARLTQARQKMNRQERNEKSPEEMQEYPYEQQIVVTDNTNTGDVLSKDVDPDLVDRLEKEPKIKAYRAMQVIDGKLYPPMSAMVNNKLREPSEVGKWEQAVESPELAENGFFKLNKGNKSTLKARYNPYFHTSLSPLNDQFSSAYKRDNLVTVEVEIPESELTSGYKAKDAKDSVGMMSWHSGPVSSKLKGNKARKVILTRYNKIIRIVPDTEVAATIAKLLDNENVTVPVNVVTPALRAELEKLGVRIDYNTKGLQTESNILYSMGIKELREQLWNDPTDSRLEIVNKPGLLQKFRGNFIDFFAEMEKKSKDIYDTYSLLRSKKAARIEQARQEYYIPLRTLIANSPWTPQEVGDMLAARHIKIDKVNIDLAERASNGFITDLAKNLTKAKRDALLEGRKNILDGKMPDGKEYLDATGSPARMSSRTMRKLMFNLMNKYASFEQKNSDGLQEVRDEWEVFKDAAGGFSDGGVAAGKVRTVDSILEGVNTDKAKFTQIANLFDAMNRHVLDILEDGHLITPQEHARLVMDKSAYAPLRRESYKFDQEVENLFRRAGQGGSKQIATRTGTAALSEPTLVLQNALAKVEAAAAATERNLANTELYEVISKDKAEWKPWFSIVDKDKYVTHDENGFLSEKNATGSSPADIVLIRDGKRLIIRPNMHNGRATGFVRAVNNLDAQELAGPMKVLGAVNQLVRAVNVSFSPVFLMRNAIMDPFTAAYNMQSNEAAKYTGDIFSNYGRAFKMLKKVFLDGNRDSNDPDVQWIERWENAGGRASFVDSLKSMDDTWRSFDSQVARRQGNMKYLMGIKDKWIDGIENFNLLFENVMRFSTFQTLVEKEVVDEKRAARISQDLTTNFTRRGYKTQMLGTWWLFFNASVQGNYQVVRNLMSSPRLQTWAGGTIAMAVMLDLLGRALAPDDWDKIPEWDKERYIIVPIKIGGDFIKIPAPWVYNTLWRAGGMIGEVIAGKRKSQDMALDLATLTATALSPMGKPGSIAQAIAPTAADPFVQILENKDFSGNPIGPEGYPGASKKANSELLWGNTPKGYQSFARFVNEATGGSATESGAIDLRPGDYQILANFLTGSLGRFLSDSTFGFGKDVKKGIEGPRDVPIIREFFSDPYDPISVQKYHTNIASIYGAHRLEQMYVKGPDRDLIKLQEVRTERGKELQMYNQAQDVERQLKSLRTRLRAAQNREDVEREKELKKKMEAVQNQFNTAYKQKVG